MLHSSLKSARSAAKQLKLNDTKTKVKNSLTCMLFIKTPIIENVRENTSFFLILKVTELVLFFNRLGGKRQRGSILSAEVPLGLSSPEKLIL